MGNGNGNILLKKSIKKFLYKEKKATIVARIKKNNIKLLICLMKSNFVKISYKAKLFCHIVYSKSYIYEICNSVVIKF